jgi:ribokinase
MREAPVVVVLASYITELIFHVPRLMKPGETVEGKFETGYGGKGFNMAIASRRAGADVRVMMKVGADLYGDTAVAMLKANGIGTEGIYRDEAKPSGAGVVLLLPTGENAISIDSGANMNLSGDEVDACLRDLRAPFVAITPLEMPVEAIIRTFGHTRVHSGTTVLNPAPAPAEGISSALIRLTDIVTPNETEAEMLTGLMLRSDNDVERAAVELVKQGFGSVVITLGKRGAYYRTGTKRGFIDAPAVDVVDTTGAGDAFNGGFATALARGNNIEESVRFGVAVASLKVTRRGTAKAMPTPEEIHTFIKGT